MATNGIEAVYLETHNWGTAAKFYQALGFTLDFETGHNSGRLCNGEGPYLLIAEVPEDQPTRTQLVLKVADAKTFDPDPIVVPDDEFAETHFGTVETTVRDADGRVWTLSAPAQGATDAH